MLENKSGNISETPKDRGKVTMDGLAIETHQRSFELDLGVDLKSRLKST